MKGILILSIIFFSCFLFAQPKSKLVLAVAPSKSIVRMDTAKLNMRSIYIDVAPGIHIIKSWAPKRKLYIDTINILAGKTFIYRKKLKYSDEYLSYRRDLRQYYINKFSPYGAIFLYGSLYYSAHSFANKFYNSAVSEKALYESSIGIVEVKDHKGQYNHYKNLYNGFVVTQNTLAIGFLAAVPVCGYFVWKHIKEGQTKPSFIEKQMLASSIDIRTDYTGRNCVVMCLNYNF